MKKVVLSLAVVAFVVSLASCSKTCTCTTYANGTAGASEEVELADGADNCEAMSTVMEMPGVGKTGLECK